MYLIDKVSSNRIEDSTSSLGGGEEETYMKMEEERDSP